MQAQNNYIQCLNDNPGLLGRELCMAEYHAALGACLSELPDC
jgi:hypothetical protein